MLKARLGLVAAPHSQCTKIDSRQNRKFVHEVAEQSTDLFGLTDSTLLKSLVPEPRFELGRSKFRGILSTLEKGGEPIFI